MGQAISKTYLPDETGHVQTPAFRNPLTDGFSTIGYYDGSPCEDFELNFLDCNEAYGPYNAPQKCKLFFQDLMECGKKYKQGERIHLMISERRKKWLKGLMGLGPQAALSTGANPQDGYAPDSFVDKTGPNYMG